MDSTTRMLVDEIVSRGWYEAGQTLGEDGWPAVRNAVGKLHHYVVEVSTLDDDDMLSRHYTVYAKDVSALKNYIANKLVNCTVLSAVEFVAEYRQVVL